MARPVFTTAPLFLLTALAAALPAAAGDAEPATTEAPSVPLALDHVIVTSTRTPRIMREVPIRTSVIDRATLDRRMSRNLADALRLMPGVRLNRIHGKRGESVSIQGLDGDRVLVLIDGVPALPSTGSTVDVTQIAVGDVERIEVIRGAQSALYGSEAMGGVINVITRRPDRDRARLELQAGSHGDTGEGTAPHTGRLLANGAVAGPDLSAELTTDWRRDDGFSVDPDSYHQDRHSLEHLNLSGRLDWDPAPGTTVSARPGLFEEEKRQRLAVALPGGQEGRRIREETVRQPSLRTNISQREATHRWQLGTSWSEFDNQVNEYRPDGSRISRREALIESARVEGQWSGWIREAQEWTVGGLVRRQRLSQQRDGANEVPDGTHHDNQELFAQASLFPTDSLELLPGARVQNDSGFGTFTSPSFNLLHARDRSSGLLNLRAGVGRGYRVPNLKERYFAFDQSDRGYMVIGNPDLEPERSTSVQLGLEWLPDNPRQPRLDINLYHNRIRDLIATEFNAERSAEEGLQVFDYQNVGRARTQGVETDLTWSPTPGWQLRLGYTLLEAEDRDTGKRLAQRPRHHTTSELAWQRGPLNVALSARYQSEVFVDSDNQETSPAYTRLRLRTEWTTERFGPPTTLLFGIDNLLDRTRDHDNPADLRPDAGRHIFAGLRLDWHGTRQ